MRFSGTLAAAVSALLLLAGPAAAEPAVTGSFTVPDFGSNNKIVAGPDGNMWLTVADGGKDVARISPDGAVESFELEGVAVPSGIAADTEGRLWVTQNGGVASFLPADPKGTSKATAIGAVKANSPIVLGPDGRMYVATEGEVVDFAPTKPEETKSAVIPGLNPKDIDVAGSLLVIADSNNKRIVTLNLAGEAVGITLLDDTATSQGVAGSPSGQIAFSKSDQTEGLGLVTPPGGPTAVLMEGDPFGVALGADGNFWFAMSAANNVQRLTPTGQATPLNGFPEQPGPTEFFPRQIAAGPNNTLWVTVEIPGGDTFQVTRISGVDPPGKPGGETPATAPETTIDKGPKKRITIKGRARRAWAKFRFSSPTPSATFECALVRKPARKGAKFPRPVFRACKSPGRLRLKPGRYRFSVRAVSGGLVDPTPASRAFRIVRPR